MRPGPDVSTVECREGCAHGLPACVNSHGDEMRKPFAMLAVLALLGVPAAGSEAQSRFGLIGGVGRATFTGGGAQGITWRTAVLVGGMADLPLGEAFSVRPELHFATKGSRRRADRTPEAALKLSYLQLPVLLQVRSGSGVLLRPRLYGGVSFGFLLGCRREKASCENISALVTHAFDVALLIGGEVEFFGAGLGLRYEAGLASVTAPGPGLGIHNGVMSLTARYLFPS